MQEEFAKPASAEGRHSQSRRMARSKRKTPASNLHATVEIVKAISSNPYGALGAIWTGTLAGGVGQPKSGDRQPFAQLCDFKDGLIWRQRNYASTIGD